MHIGPLLLFDGHCAFCNANVRFPMKEDQHHLLGRTLRTVPGPIADAGYDFAGRMRYRLGGKLDYCPLPPRN